MMLEIIKQAEYLPDSHAFLFPAQLVSPVCLMVKEFRSEDVYDSDRTPKATAFGAIRRGAERLPGRHLYAVLAEQDERPVSRFRSHKGVLPLRSSLRQLDHRNLDVTVDANKSRLGAVISIGDVLPLNDVDLLIDTATSVLVLTHMSIDDLVVMAAKWMASPRFGLTGLDFDVITQSILAHPQNIVLRHFAADSSWNEKLLLIYEQSAAEDAAFLANEIVI